MLLRFTPRNQRMTARQTMKSQTARVSGPEAGKIDAIKYRREMAGNSRQFLTPETGLRSALVAPMPGA